MKIKLAAAGFAAAMSLAGISGALAAKPADPGNQGKTTICHATASEKNPYVVITISNSAVASPHLADPGHNKNGGQDGEWNAEGGCQNGE